MAIPELLVVIAGVAALGADPRAPRMALSRRRMAVTFVEKVWKRFVDVIVNTQKDLMKRS